MKRMAVLVDGPEPDPSTIHIPDQPGPPGASFQIWLSKGLPGRVAAYSVPAGRAPLATVRGWEEPNTNGHMYKGPYWTLDPFLICLACPTLATNLGKIRV